MPCIYSLRAIQQKGLSDRLYQCRWVLRSDYLTACNQAGRFLPEEPYEWHETGLSEDGAINLEAPRKWRLLREKTGHGAFHGMNIIVYGECIAPPLVWPISFFYFIDLLLMTKTKVSVMSPPCISL